MQDKQQTNRRTQPRRDEENAPNRTEQFLQLYGVAYPRIYACILSLLPDKNEAEEILQETSLVLWRRFSDFEPEGDFVRWACGIACNQIRKFRRERARSAVQFSDETLERIATVRQQRSEMLESRRRHLLQCVDSLPSDDRELLRRCCERAASIKQVAEELDRPANTVYKAMKRIREALKRCVDLAMRREEHP